MIVKYFFWVYVSMVAMQNESKSKFSNGVDEVSALKKYVRITDYLSVAQIFLKDNVMLDAPLSKEHIKPRLLGHWGTCPGINSVYAHINRLINKNEDRDFLFVVGPGHGFPAFQANLFLEGSLSSAYPEKVQYSKDGIEEICKKFSAPYGYPSHLTPEAPGVVLEGGELGYSLSLSYGTVFDNPKLITVCLVGDGEAETGPLAASWNGNRFINPKSDGAVLPVVHRNGYKISGPTVLGRMSDEDVRKLFEGYGYKPLFVTYESDESFHKELMGAFNIAVEHIREVQEDAREGGGDAAPRWPVIILTTPKGMGGIKEVDGEKVEGNHLSHQVVFKDLHENESHVKELEK